MPAFIKTPADEARWAKAKKAASKTLSESDGDSYWKLTNSIYQKMNKGEDVCIPKDELVEEHKHLVGVLESPSHKDDAVEAKKQKKELKEYKKAKDLDKSIKDFFENVKTSDDASSLNELKSFLEKARRRMSDEQSDDEEENDLGEGFREFDPDTEEDDASKWLQDNDPEQQQSEDENEEPIDEGESYHDYDPGEGESASMQGREEGGAEGSGIEEPSQEEEVTPEDEAAAVPAAQAAAAKPPSAEIPKSESRFPQPTKGEIAEMRQYTRPWEQRARDKVRLEASPEKNPVLHHEGRLVEARNTAHKSRQDAFKEFQASPEYKNADPITQMEMDSKFNKEFHEKNPNYLSNAAKVHGEAHEKGRGAKDIHAAAKDEQIRHVLGGGAQAEAPVSMEEGMQHAGGAKGEEGTVGSMVQDPSSSFAAGNKEFLNQYAKDYANKAKKPKDVNDMAQYDEGSRADVGRILGDHPALKDPKNKAKVDAFFQKYHPLIAMNAHKVLNKLGLDHKKGDIDLGMLHEAGMHGLMQSINDYDHDHPSKASFATHASNKIRGLQQTALRDKDAIPAELRAGAKKFGAADILKKYPNLADRHKRIQTARQVVPLKPKMLKPEGGGEQ